jgi:hypothetical protein
VTRRRAAVLALATLCIAFAAVHGLDGGLLFLAPAALLALPLSLGRYIGEQRLAGRLPRARVLRVRAISPSPRPLRATIGELIARLLAVRPPPALTT